MSRYIQQDSPKKESKEEKPTPKFGGKGGKKDYTELTKGKKIVSPNGGVR